MHARFRLTGFPALRDDVSSPADVDGDGEGFPRYEFEFAQEAGQCVVRMRWQFADPWDPVGHCEAPGQDELLLACFRSLGIEPRRMREGSWAVPSGAVERLCDALKARLGDPNIAPLP